MSELKAFVLMPFDEDLADVYEHLIEDALSKAGYTPRRADDIQSQQNILRDIVGSIVECDLVVADLSNNNPNVFYELGTAHALGKKTILLAQHLDDVPFDLQSYRIITYDTHFSEMKAAKSELIEVAKKARSGSVPFGNPTTDYAASKNLSPSELFKSPKSHTDDSTHEKGVIDHIADFEEASLELLDAISEINGQLQSITQSANSFDRKRKRVQNSRKQGAAILLRKAAQDLAEDINSFADAVKDENARYANALSRTKEGLEFIVSQPRSFDQIDREQVEHFVEQLVMAASQAEGARDGISGAAEAMLEGRGIESQLTQAVERGEESLGSYVSHLDRTVSVFERAIDVAQQHLD